jgi:hypothetical protein
MTNSPQSKSWRDLLPVHPAAELFPLMAEAELRELGKDIKAHGLVSSIVLYKGKLLDGRNRLDALELVGIKFGFMYGTEPATRDKFFALHGCNGDLPDNDGTLVAHLDSDPYDYVIAANLHRRHLTAEQKRDLIAKLLKAKPETSDRVIAKQTKADHKTVGKARSKLEGRGEIPHVERRTDTKGRKQPASKPKQPSRKDLGAVPRADHASKSRPAAAAEVSTERRKAEMAALATAPPDLVDQAIRLVEQMTADQRQDFLSRLMEKGLLTEEKASIDLLQATSAVVERDLRLGLVTEDELSDLSIPEFLRAPPDPDAGSSETPAAAGTLNGAPTNGRRPQ